MGALRNIRKYSLHTNKLIKKLTKINGTKDSKNKLSISDLNLLPVNETWHKKITYLWDISELSAQNKLSEFIEVKLSEYKKIVIIPSRNKRLFHRHTYILVRYHPRKFWRESIILLI